MIVAASHIEVDLPIICFYKLSRKSHEMGGFVRSVFYYTAVKRLSNRIWQSILRLKGNSEKDNKLTQVILLKTKIIIRSSSHEMGGLVANILKI